MENNAASIHVQGCLIESFCDMVFKQIGWKYIEPCFTRNVSVAQITHDAQDKTVQDKFCMPLAESAAPARVLLTVTRSTTTRLTRVVCGSEQQDAEEAVSDSAAY